MASNPPLYLGNQRAQLARPGENGPAHVRGQSPVRERAFSSEAGRSQSEPESESDGGVLAIVNGPNDSRPHFRPHDRNDVRNDEAVKAITDAMAAARWDTESDDDEGTKQPVNLHLLHPEAAYTLVPGSPDSLSSGAAADTEGAADEDALDDCSFLTEDDEKGTATQNWGIGEALVANEESITSAVEPIATEDAPTTEATAMMEAVDVDAINTEVHDGETGFPGGFQFVWGSAPATPFHQTADNGSGAVPNTATTVMDQCQTAVQGLGPGIAHGHVATASTGVVRTANNAPGTANPVADGHDGTDEVTPATPPPLQPMDLQHPINKHRMCMPLPMIGNRVNILWAPYVEYALGGGNLQLAEPVHPSLNIRADVNMANITDLQSAGIRMDCIGGVVLHALARDPVTEEAFTLAGYRQHGLNLNTAVTEEDALQLQRSLGIGGPVDLRDTRIRLRGPSEQGGPRDAATAAIRDDRSDWDDPDHRPPPAVVRDGQTGTLVEARLVDATDVGLAVGGSSSSERCRSGKAAEKRGRQAATAPGTFYSMPAEIRQKIFSLAAARAGRAVLLLNNARERHTVAMMRVVARSTNERLGVLRLNSDAFCWLKRQYKLMFTPRWESYKYDRHTWECPSIPADATCRGYIVNPEADIIIVEPCGYMCRYNQCAKKQWSDEDRAVVTHLGVQMDPQEIVKGCLSHIWTTIHLAWPNVETLCMIRAWVDPKVEWPGRIYPPTLMRHHLGTDAELVWSGGRKFAVPLRSRSTPETVRLAQEFAEWRKYAGRDRVLKNIEFVVMASEREHRPGTWAGDQYYAVADEERATGNRTDLIMKNFVPRKVSVPIK